MTYHYEPLLAVFDGWMVVLLLALSLVAGVRLRGVRRPLVAGGFVLCALATILWVPMVSYITLMPLVGLVGPHLAWELPTVPWLAGLVLVTLGVFRRAPDHPAAGPDAGRLGAFPPPTSPPPTSPSAGQPVAPAPVPTGRPVRPDDFVPAISSGERWS